MNDLPQQQQTCFHFTYKDDSDNNVYPIIFSSKFDSGNCAKA